MKVLPPEIWRQILTTLPINTECARSIASFSAVSKNFFVITRDSTIWKPYYVERYKHADLVSDCARRTRFHEDWTGLYYERRIFDYNTVQELRLMIQEQDPNAELPVARKIVEKGLDVYDVLDEIAGAQTAGIMNFHSDDTTHAGDSTIDFKSVLRTWAYRLLCIITTRDALGRWNQLRRNLRGEESAQLCFEEAFACLSSFHGILADDVLMHVYALGDDLRDDQSIIFDPSNANFDLKKLCTEVVAFMHYKGFKRGLARQFYNIENSFPHTFLTTHKCGIPLSLVFIFVTIMKRLGFQATPYPAGGTVVAVVSELLVVDVFLREISQLSSPTMARILLPDADPRNVRGNVDLIIKLLLRAARNVATVFNMHGISSSPFTERAHVAVRCITGLFLPNPTLASGVPADAHYWDVQFEDVMPVEKELMIAGFISSIIS